MLGYNTDDIFLQRQNSKPMVERLIKQFHGDLRSNRTHRNYFFGILYVFHLNRSVNMFSSIIYNIEHTKITIVVVSL